MFCLLIDAYSQPKLAMPFTHLNISLWFSFSMSTTKPLNSVLPMSTILSLSVHIFLSCLSVHWTNKTCFLSLDPPHLVVFRYSFKPSLHCHCSLCPIRSLTQTLTKVSDFLLPFLPFMIDLLSFCQISLLLIPSIYEPLVVSYCMWSKV